MRFFSTAFRIGLLSAVLCGTMRVSVAAQSTAAKPDTNAPTTKQDQDEALRNEEKANKQREKAAKAQRKALRAQDKADAAAKKAGLPPQH